MGIRLYFRNKDKPKEEFCMGKLLHYAEYKENLTCVWFLEQINALDDYWTDSELRTDYYYCENVVELFITLCNCTPYIDYGDLFEMSSEDLFYFLFLYYEDMCKIYGLMITEKYQAIAEASAFIMKNASCESRWEFRLGA